MEKCLLHLLALIAALTSVTDSQPGGPSGPSDDPCANCKIVNGIGFAASDSCWNYWQCNRREDGIWEAVNMKTSIGSFWEQTILSQQIVSLASCPNDPCIGRPAGFRMNGFDNCRIMIVCDGGRTIDAQCCLPGERAIDGGCTPDPTCTDSCSNPIPTGPPRACNLAPDTNDPGKFLIIDGMVQTPMNCAPGTVFNPAICGCEHSGVVVLPTPCETRPEVDLRFLADGAVEDRSRNGYSTTNRNFATVADPRSDTGYVAVFNGSTLLRITNSNSDFSRRFTMRAVYNYVGSQANAALVSNVECEDTLSTVSISVSPNGATGTIRTVPDNTNTVTANGGAGFRTVVMHFNGETLDIAIDGGPAESVVTGPLLFTMGQNCIDGLKLGREDGRSGFEGQLAEFQIWKCIANP